MDSIINICPMAQRGEYVTAARQQARQLHSQADACLDPAEAHDLRMEASELFDLAACAADTLGAKGLLLN